jgi:hypothetical protein
MCVLKQFAQAHLHLQFHFVCLGSSEFIVQLLHLYALSKLINHSDYHCYSCSLYNTVCCSLHWRLFGEKAVL